MRRLFITLSAVLVSSAALAQGTIRFNNRVAGQVDAPVFISTSQTAGVGPWWTAQLFLVTGDGASAVSTPLNPSATFNDGSTNPLLARYLVEPKEAVIVPGVPPGAQATIVMRAWCSFYTPWGLLNFDGQSAPVTVTLGGTLPSGETLAPATLSGLQGFGTGPLSPPSVFIGATRQSNIWHLNIVRFWQSRSYALESSHDFVNWSPVLTNQTLETVTIPLQRSNSVPVFFRMRAE